MKQKIHPRYGTTKIIANNGTEFEVKSCLYVLENSQYHLAVDPFTHPAWTKLNTSSKISNNDNRMSKFDGINNI